jgi:uncharacterized protein YfbU (UPF0304 family)
MPSAANYKNEMPALERISDFIEARFRHPDTKTLNILNSSLAAWLRYFRFLEVTRNRYAEISTAYVDAVHRQLERTQKEVQQAGAGTSRPVTAEEWEEMQRTAELGIRLHLEIESFYIFANILLDRVASTFRFYFWKRSDWNHRHVMDNLEKVCTEKPLRVPSKDLLAMPRKLGELIVQYRNKRIEHVEEPRLIFGTAWGPNKKAKILANILYPTQEEAEKMAQFQQSTGDLDEVLQMLDTYMVAILDLFEANAQKSILPPPKEKTAHTQ